MEKFTNRHQAGQLLAKQLRAYSKKPHVRVLALPRGGVPVGFEIAQALQVPLDVFVVRKLGVPGNRELAMGAIASGNARFLNHHVIDTLSIPMKVVDVVTRQEQTELERRERMYCEDQPFPDLKNETIILVDDGLATGATMRASIMALKRHKPARIILTIPVAPQEVCADISSLVDEVVCALQPTDFGSVGRWYLDFTQVNDEIVCSLLQTANQKETAVGAKL